MTPTVTDPCARLEANRAFLRVQLLASQVHSGTAAAGRAPPFTAYFIGLLAAIAQGGTPVECLVAWWKSLPFAQALEAVADSAQTLLRPTAARYPGRLILGAALFGAIIVWIRPWRWLSTNGVTETLRAGADLVSTHDPKGEYLSGLLERLFRQQSPPVP